MEKEKVSLGLKVVPNGEMVYGVQLVAGHQYLFITEISLPEGRFCRLWPTFEPGRGQWFNTKEFEPWEAPKAEKPKDLFAFEEIIKKHNFTSILTGRAEEMAHHLIAWTVVGLHVNQGWKPDFQNQNELKWYAFISRDGKIKEGCDSVSNSGAVYFKSQDLLRKAIDANQEIVYGMFGWKKKEKKDPEEPASPKLSFEENLDLIVNAFVEKFRKIKDGQRAELMMEFYKQHLDSKTNPEVKTNYIVKQLAKYRIAVAVI